MITSVNNPRIKWLRELQAHSRARRESGLFVVEGVRLAEEALQAGIRPEWVLYTAGLSPRGRQVVEAFARAGAPVEEAAPHVLKAAGETEAPQGLLAVLPARPHPLPDGPDFLLILDEIRDPGNLGAILRTALAAGVQAVLLAPGSADLYSPKVVRAAMGAHFRLPVHPLGWPDIRDCLVPGAARPALQVYLAGARQGVSCFQADFRAPLALIVGGEAQGAGIEARRLAGGGVHIPMAAHVESLNAAAAAAVLLFEVVRQRNPAR